MTTQTTTGTARSGQDLAPRTPAVLTFAVLAPLLAAVGMHLLGATAVTAVLVLVLVVVAASASGLRAAGVVAALAAGLSFDFFLVQPELSLTIAEPEEVQATVLLLITGIAVSEIALWGRRQQARASRRSGYLDGVLRTADVVAARPADPRQLAAQVADQVRDLLGADDCRFEPAVTTPGRRAAASATVLERDGSVTRRGAVLDVDRQGLPTDDLLRLEVATGRTVHGRFLVSAATRVVRPSVEQRRVAALLADQVAAAYAAAGTPGAEGAAGTPGAPGTAGVPGGTGAAGASGAAGGAGAAGSAGTPGDAGAADSSGTSGDAGAAASSSTPGGAGAPGSPGRHASSGVLPAPGSEARVATEPRAREHRRP